MHILETDIEHVLEVLQLVPDFQDVPAIEEAKERARGRKYLALVGQINGDAVGCKFGYALDDDAFYSWIGGVLPEYRKHGVAQGLLEFQEQWVWAQGFQRIRVKSMNQYPAMLRFLIKNRYQITGVEGDSPESLKVHFSKQR